MEKQRSPSYHTFEARARAHVAERLAIAGSANFFDLRPREVLHTEDIADELRTWPVADVGSALVALLDTPETTRLVQGVIREFDADYADWDALFTQFPQLEPHI